MRKDEDEGLLDELQEDIGADYSPHLRAAARMFSGDPQAAVPYLLFSIAKSLEDVSYLLSNDSLSVIMDADEEELPRGVTARSHRQAKTGCSRWATRVTRP